nr:type III PLP-dependent enzyme [Amycolatopsis arida]
MTNTLTDTPHRIRRFLADHDPPTPCLVIDVDTVLDRYRALTGAFPGARVLYAVKANPEPAVVDALVAAGTGFDVASPGEIDLCLDRGAAPAALSYGNPIKKPSAIALAAARGVREFVCDAESDVANVAEHAPGAAVSVRLLTDSPDSVTPFGQKFGCPPERAADLLVRAADLGLDPLGLAFHVGSQQLDASAWEVAIAAAGRVAAAAAERGVPVRRLNVGGGFAVPYTGPAPDLAEYAARIDAALRAHFTDPPELALEPGRAVVAEAGLIRAEVVLVTQRSPADPRRWVYLDIGRYNGLAETENEAITYPVEPVDVDGDGDGPVVLAGPTCDGDDVLYQRTPYRLPLALRAGHRLDLRNTGAYTASYSSVAFNGIEPLRTYCLLGGRLISAGAGTPADR